jgi:hypothetical protein
MTNKEDTDSPRSLYSAPNSSAVARFYTHKSLIFSPIDIGLAASRTRLYGFYDLSPEESHADPELFKSVFFQAPMIHGSAYFSAGADVIASELQERMRANRNACSTASCDHAEIASLNLGDSIRLEAWILAAEKRQFFVREGGSVLTGSRTWPSTTLMCVANISHNFEFYKTFGQLNMPSLLPRSVYYDLVRDRSLCVAEEWVAHGFPHPEIAEVADLAARFPCKHLLNKFDAGGVPQPSLDLPQQRKLLGNGMHLGQVSLWLLFNIAFGPPLRPAPESTS